MFGAWRQGCESIWQRPICSWSWHQSPRKNKIANFDFFRKLRTAVYPSNMAPFGLKLWQSAFQMIPDIWFSDAQKIFLMKFSEQKVSMKSKIACFGGATIFWALPADSPRKITPDVPNFKSLRSLVKGLKDGFRFFRWLLAQNRLTLFLPGWWYDDMMLLWYDDSVIWWDGDSTIWRYDAAMIWWCDNMVK